jgi:hypothetical protein
MKRLILILTFLIAVSESHAAITCEVISSNCVQYGAIVDTPNGSYSDPDACSKHEEITECSSDEVTSSCTDEDVTGCQLAKTEEIDYNADGSVAAWEQTWVCETIEAEECVPESLSIDALEADDFCNVTEESCDDSINGVCAKERITYACQEPTEPCFESGNGETCELASTSCISGVDNQGLGCLTEEQIWECSKETTECARVGVVNTCNIDMTNGLDSHKQDDHSQALADLASGMQLAKAIENSISGVPPRVFGGEQLHCTRDLMGATGLGENCCSINAETGDGSLFDQCTAMDEKLAVARKADRTKYITEADHVRQYIDLMVGGFCSFTEKKRQYYCGFDSMLGRIIQEQGREQLKQIALNSQGGGTAFVQFNYIDSGNGRWVSDSVAGFTLSAKSHPAVCEGETSSTNSECPDALQIPIKVIGSGETHLREVDALSDAAFALSKTVLIAPGSHGSYCNTDIESSSYGECEMRLKVWEQKSGEVSVPVNIVQNRYSETSRWSDVIYGGDDWEFQVWLTAFADAPIDDTQPVNIRWSKGGSPWTSVTLPSPLDVSENKMLNSEAPIYGECVNAECSYTVRLPLASTVKPWIASTESRQNGCEKRHTLDCSGFTITEFQMLDVGKMDLSEFEASVREKMKDDLPDAASYESTAMASAQRGASKAQSGIKTDLSEEQMNPSATYYSARLEDGQILEGEEGKAFATLDWPRANSNNPVSSAHVDWGDGNDSAMTVSGGEYVATHTYSNSGEYTVLVKQIMPNGTEHVKRLTLVVEEPFNSIPGLGGSPF